MPGYLCAQNLDETYINEITGYKNMDSFLCTSYTHYACYILHFIHKIAPMVLFIVWVKIMCIVSVKFTPSRKNH